MAKRLVYILIAFLAVSGFAATQGTLIDKRDGKKYKTVKIGDQTWMAENLNYNAASSFCYNNRECNCAKYGRLYTWAVAVGKSEEACGYGHTCSLLSDNIQGVCPDGWHLPSKVEWEILFYAVGGKDVAGMKLKSTSDWKENGNGDDAFGYSALPAGNRLNNGFYRNEGYYANFWSSSEDDSYLAYYMGLYYGSDNADPNYDSKNDGLSVRCLKDSQ
ncbi:MAG: fibrobacter succinogenes major paralogous domain-containing protein [Fibrobacter sp.]|nr:fibrobacter succinogenes major paralogous domain-containing protein [Fibrobacter sp.]